MQNEKMYAAQDTGQIVVEGDHLRIGVGNLWRQTDAGEPHPSEGNPTAGLWLFFRDHAEWNRHVRLAAGEAIEAGGYHVRLSEVNLEKGMVVVGVTPPPV